MYSRPTDSKTTMDVSKEKIDDNARNTNKFNQPASGHSSSSSSGNDSPDLPSRASRSDRLQTISKSSRTAITKGTTSSTITQAASTMLNVHCENDKTSILTTNATSNEEEPHEISGRICRFHNKLM